MAALKLAEPFSGRLIRARLGRGWLRAVDERLLRLGNLELGYERDGHPNDQALFELGATVTTHHDVRVSPLVASELVTAAAQAIENPGERMIGENLRCRATWLTQSVIRKSFLSAIAAT